MRPKEGYVQIQVPVRPDAFVRIGRSSLTRPHGSGSDPLWVTLRVPIVR